MKLVHLTIITILLNFMFAPDCNGQAKRKRPMIEFSCLLWEGPLTEPIYFLNDKKYTEIKSFTTSRSLPHKIAARKKFTLYVKRKVEVEKDGEMVEEIVYKPVGSVAIPEGMKKILFILFPNPKGDELQIRMIAFDDSSKGFPAGSFRFVNFSKAELRVKFAGSSKKLPPQKATVMSSKVDKKGGLIPFVIQNNSGKIVFQTRLFAQTNGREIIFISRPKEKGALPQVKFISQLLPKVVPQPVEGR